MPSGVRRGAEHVVQRVSKFARLRDREPKVGMRNRRSGLGLNPHILSMHADAPTERYRHLRAPQRFLVRGDK
jgi:hypothetical protein